MGREDLKNRAQLTVILDKEVIAYVRSIKDKTGMPIARYIENLIKEDMKKQAKQEDAE